MLRDHGREDRYGHKMVGHNLRLSEIQGAIGQVQLSHLDRLNEGRRTNGTLYNEALSGIEGLVLPNIPEDSKEHVFHLYVVRIDENLRNDFRGFLNGKGISNNIHYPIPGHRAIATEEALGVQESLPTTERICSEIVSLPMYPSLTKEEIDYVGGSIEEFFK